MILLIDNYDSFSYNLYQYLGEMESDIRVVRNDEMTPEQVYELKPDHIVISPGPGRPENAGYIVDVIKKMAGVVPILGVCLGHQAICQAFGATVGYAGRLMHGKQSMVSLDRNDPLFKGCSEKTPVARYHSLAVEESTLPDELKVTAATQEGEVMAVSHTLYPVFGMQFHPESIMTPEGKLMLKNFLDVK